MTDELTLLEVEANEQRARYEAMQSMMADMGWRWFIVECSQEMENAQEMLVYASGEQDVGRLQGRIDAFRQILAFEDAVDVALSTNAEEDDDADV